MDAIRWTTCRLYLGLPKARLYRAAEVRLPQGTSWRKPRDGLQVVPKLGHVVGVFESDGKRSIVRPLHPSER
jgi:hypothetical protein